MTSASARLTLTLVPILCGAIFAASCADSVPTNASVTGAETAVTVNRATSPSVRATTPVTISRFSVDLTVPAYPVCPFNPSAGEITGTGVLTILMRTITDSNGGTHIGTTIVGHGTAIDINGERWIWSDADLNNELFPSGNTSSNTFTTTTVEGFHVIGPKGQKVMVQGTFHITEVNGRTVVEVERGNHEEGEICESGFALTPLP